MIQADAIVSALKKHPCVVDACVQQTRTSRTDEKYAYTIHVSCIVGGCEVQIQMKVPVNRDFHLCKFVLPNYQEMPFIPHVENDGAICYYDPDEVTPFGPFLELMFASFVRVVDILQNGITGNNKDDFVKEFERYWMKLPDARILYSYVDTGKETRVIKYAQEYQKPADKLKRKKETLSDVKKRTGNLFLYCADDGSDISKYGDKLTIRNGVLVSIKATESVLPPDCRRQLTNDYIDALLNSSHVDKKALLSVFSCTSGKRFIFFDIHQPQNVQTNFAVFVDDIRVERANGGNIFHTTGAIIPCIVTQCNRDYLVQRGGGSNGFDQKKILVIGCGSIGGYLISELVKAGFTHIDVADPDRLKMENIYRHCLGKDYIGEYKVRAIHRFLDKNYSGIVIKEIVDDIESQVVERDITLSDYSLIISAVGSHSVNKWLDQYIHNHKINAPVVYLWHEVLGIGNHVSFISRNHPGCYNCLFVMKETEIIDDTTYCKGNQGFSVKLHGCGSTYLPYGSIVSLLSASLGVRTALEYFEGRISENFTTSVKGDAYYFRKMGFETSSRYDLQDRTEATVTGSQFQRESCLCMKGS